VRVQFRHTRQIAPGVSANQIRDFVNAFNAMSARDLNGFDGFLGGLLRDETRPTIPFLFDQIGNRRQIVFGLTEPTLRFLL
jgi:hypothetical protein